VRLHRRHAASRAWTLSFEPPFAHVFRRSSRAQIFRSAGGQNACQRASPEPTDLGRVFCDLVMKGGITSGVVYPSAIARLAVKYRLRNIGGSAGAIAAGAAAAAEYRRQTDSAHPDAGFERLGGLGAELGRPPAGATSTHSRMFHLFAPTAPALPPRRTRPGYK